MELPLFRLSYKEAIAEKCRDCIYDDKHYGGIAQQVATCLQTSCSLHSVRPINKSKTKLPLSLLEKYGIEVEQLDDRAKELVVD